VGSGGRLRSSRVSDYWSGQAPSPLDLKAGAAAVAGGEGEQKVAAAASCGRAVRRLGRRMAVRSRRLGRRWKKACAMGSSNLA